MRRLAVRLWRSREGAVAPIVALALTALIAAGGIAFDYAHMAAMDTELQDAADHSALAAATQLDGEAGARTRATAAANSLITNDTRFAKRDATHTGNVGVAQVSFYSAYTDATTKTAATTDADAKFVEVKVDTRTADYAFTPVVGAFYGSLDAKAVAGVSSAICGVVPFFVCNPVEPATNNDVNYPVDVASGIGIQMLEGGQQKGPGNFGFLAYAGVGAKNLEEALSTDAPKDDCLAISNQVTTEPGQKTSVFDGLNRRFDMITSCPNAPCSSSTNEIKDLVRQSGSCNWKENPTTAASLTTNAPGRYRPTSSTVPLATSVTPEIMGHPRDMCHAAQPLGGAACPKGQIGNGVWDIGAYFRSNHPGVNWATTAGLDRNNDGKVTRYETYLWEAEDAASRLTKRNSSTSGWAAYGTPQAGVCNPPGIAPNTNGIDRRRLTAAVVNCHAYGKINGRKDLPVAGYIDVFLVEPTLARTKCSDKGKDCSTAITDNQDIYVEVIGASGTADGGATPQITRRSVPRLIE